MTKESRRDLHYYLDVLKTRSAGSRLWVIDQALWTASWDPLRKSLCQSSHCAYMVDVESKREGVNRWCIFFSFAKALTIKLHIITAAVSE